MNDEKEKTPSFGLYLLFSEAIQFITPEIEAALLEDFPDLDIQMEGALDLPQYCDTDDSITAPILMGAGGADSCGVAHLMRVPGFGRWDPAQIQDRQMIAALDIDLKDALRRNRSYLCISVGAKSNDLADIFRAARLCSCLGALFADLPICLAAYWESADHFLSPKAICDMADDAMRGNWPLQQWIGLIMDPIGRDQHGTPWLNGFTRGLLPFTGYELSMPGAPLEPSEIAATLLATAWMPLSNGNTFQDGHTIGDQDPQSDQHYRLRWLPAGATGPKHNNLASPVDFFLILHPQSRFDEEAYFGTPNPVSGKRLKATFGVKPGFFKRKLAAGARR